LKFNNATWSCMSTKRSSVRRDSGRPRGAPIESVVLLRTLEELAVAGIDGLSIERIAKRAEVNKTSVYRRWPTREALIVAALESVLDNVAAEVPDTGSLAGDLKALVSPIAATVSDPIGKALVRAAFSESSASAVSALATKKLAEHTENPVRELVARAKARGEWRTGVKGDQLIFTLVGAILHRVMLEHAPISQRWLDGLIDLILHGVAPRSSR
jgi:AcrR family transcriptional regulator